MTNPTLRFKSELCNAFPDWGVVKIKDLSEKMIGGGTPDKNNLEFWTGSVPWISSSDLSLDNINEVKITRFISDSALKNSATKLIPKGSILIVSRVGVGKVAVAPCDLCTSQDFTSLINIKCDSFFLAYALIKHMSKKLNEVQGTSIKGITSREIKESSINIPCLEEQQKIASFLSALDQKIELNERKIEALERLKKWLLKKIFSQELRFRDKNGRDFPLWNEAVLSSISEKITVGIANSATHAYTKRGIALIRNTNIKPNYLDETDIAHITQDFAKKYESKKLKTGDILICRTGYPGTACLVPKKYEGAQTFTTLIVRIDKSYALPAYVCQYINSDKGKEYLNKTSIGGGQKNSGAGIIKDLLIPIPGIDEQYAILEILQSLDNKISTITTKLDSIKRLKQGFMQQMFI